MFSSESKLARACLLTNYTLHMELGRLISSILSTIPVIGFIVYGFVALHTIKTNHLSIKDMNKDFNWYITITTYCMNETAPSLDSVTSHGLVECHLFRYMIHVRTMRPLTSFMHVSYVSYDSYENLKTLTRIYIWELMTLTGIDRDTKTVCETCNNKQKILQSNEDTRSPPT